jgi:hypothetical protein
MLRATLRDDDSVWRDSHRWQPSRGDQLVRRVAPDSKDVFHVTQLQHTDTRRCPFRGLESLSTASVLQQQWDPRSGTNVLSGSALEVGAN